MTEPQEVLAELSVNEVIARYPETLAVFNEFGIDSCCGGAASVRAAAARDGAEPEAVLAALIAQVTAVAR